MPAHEPADKRSQDLIDDNLKKAFGQTLDEGVPDRFKDLLAQLKDAAPNTSSSDASSQESEK
ncbi:NepR family anti-sigma factor [Aliiroseovarius sediminis]|uniref:NepR family anti-sigma factor n=1 Tax=Aliiroseovarius sediminis TaxID=2925839 RepID=UPI001F5AAA18|nr:NepR family anti-sigma factor [Aliiroseovarius sediminis]MCI2394034.1 RNA polymerase subunit sigma-70 [Aliiroseovarius sediminis]